MSTCLHDYMSTYLSCLHIPIISTYIHIISTYISYLHTYHVYISCLHIMSTYIVYTYMYIYRYLYHTNPIMIYIGTSYLHIMSTCLPTYICLRRRLTFTDLFGMPHLQSGKRHSLYRQSDEKSASCIRVARFSLLQHTKTGKIYQNN
jgi:hypothetical protein